MKLFERDGATVSTSRTVLSMLLTVQYCMLKCGLRKSYKILNRFGVSKQRFLHNWIRKFFSFSWKCGKNLTEAEIWSTQIILHISKNAIVSNLAIEYLKHFCVHSNFLDKILWELYIMGDNCIRNVLLQVVTGTESLTQTLWVRLPVDLFSTTGCQMAVCEEERESAFIWSLRVNWTVWKLIKTNLIAFYQKTVFSKSSKQIYVEITSMFSALSEI